MGWEGWVGDARVGDARVGDARGFGKSGQGRTFGGPLSPPTLMKLLTLR